MAVRRSFRNKIIFFTCLLLMMQGIQSVAHAQKMGKKYKKERVKVDANGSSDSKKGKKKKAWKPDKRSKGAKKREAAKSYTTGEKRKQISPLTRKSIQGKDFIGRRKTYRDKLTRKERKEIEKAEGNIDKKPVLKKEKKEKRDFEKTQKKMMKRHLKLQDPDTRKRMKKHKKNTTKQIKRDMHPRSKKKVR